MNAHALVRVLVAVLLLGTLFAWGNFGYELVQWRSAGGGVGCVADSTNPFLTPCFYGALTFTIAFIISVFLLLSLSVSRQGSGTGTRVLAFGAFDPLHEGHKDFLRQAKELGDHLTVVVAHDSAIRAYKQREPRTAEEERLAAVRAVPYADEVILGRKTADRYHLLGEVDFDILALGYNQQPSDEEVRAKLNEKGKYRVRIVRLQAYHPDKYPPA